MTSNAPRYDLSLNPPYQINYRAKRAGKHISASKRRITFQFGFSSARAITAGLSQVECRGEEHEVVLIWSHMTGKRQLFMDGREIHMSKAARGNTKFEYSWGIGGNHVLKMIANGTPQAGIKQFDLNLDGMSFFEFSKIYELGRSSRGGESVASAAYSYRGMGYDARDDEEEEQPPPMPEVKVTDLFDSQPSSLMSPISQPSSLMSPISQYGSIPSLLGSACSMSTSSYDEFTPVENCNRQRSFDSISNDILGAYSTPTPPAPVSASQQSSSRALVPVSEEGMDAITKSMKNLVNLEDITTTPLQPYSLAPTSPSLNTMKKGEANWGLVGRAPTLAEMRGSAQSPTMSVQEVMKAHPNQYAAQHSYHPAQHQAYQGAAAPSYGYQYGASQGQQQYAPAY
mmetsp:Transcript_24606/g.53034  ORF Transcript_24606/g.53034 Transcript_24606/m.53034 type:complete len:399 (+) Transcript_24606:454-1650(+)|eukprot:CAMPEP_0172310154 /NCGR_PEP_ID=MMETSP1058-20130122/11319_1 /TAXON_ID=83371 /ORGANISM="Detonula confervacea, Strain CCMP 353" /LENGTH=398 /DNA_ID=CAMNT_0013022923 /DNA_START=423 /DNA_END=1619 /DNA_ORIENTATION=+